MTPAQFLIKPDAITNQVQSRDRRLMTAWTAYKKNLCPHCGYPISVCRNEERFEAKRETCFAQESVEKADKDSRDKDGNKPPGLVIEPVYQEPVDI